MNRRHFSQSLLSLPAAASAQAPATSDTWQEPARNLPTRRYDVVVAGGALAV
jgi:hypothetical protein